MRVLPGGAAAFIATVITSAAERAEPAFDLALADTEVLCCYFADSITRKTIRTVMSRESHDRSHAA